MRERSGAQSLLRTSLIFIVIVLLLSPIYLGAHTLLSRLILDTGYFDRILDENTASKLVGGLAAAVIVLLFNPFRHRIEWLVGRLFSRGRVDHRQALLVFTRQVRLIQTLDPLLDALMELISNTVMPRFCAILLSPRPGRGLVTVRQVGVVAVDLGMISSEDPLLVHALDAGEALTMDNVVHGSTVWRAWRQMDVVQIVPLVVGENVVGLLVLGPKRLGRRYSHEDLWMLNALADQGAVAIENARLYDQSIRRTVEETALFEMGAAISSSLEEDDVLEETALQLTSLLQVDGCLIYDWDQVRNCLFNRLVYFAKREVVLPEPCDWLSLDDHPANQVLQGRLPQAISAIESPDQAQRLPLIASGQMYTVLMLPLIARDNVIGLMEFYSSAPRRTFQPRDIQLGQTLANQAAVIIANARLYKQARRRTNELSALVQSGMVVSTILDVQGALELISREMVQILRAAGCRVSTWDRERDQIVSWLDYHLPDVLWVPGSLGMTYPLESRPHLALALQELCVVAVTIPLPVQTPAASLRPGVAQTVLAIPLIARGEAIGVIELGAANTDRSFTEWEIGLAQSLVNQAATAIENARTYEEQRIAARNLERRVQARTAELDEAMHTVLVESSKREAILEGVTDGVLFVDAEGEITSFNTAAAQLLSMSRDTVLGNSVEGFVARLNLPGQIWQEIPRYWAKMRENPNKRTFVKERYEADGRIFNIHLSPVVRERRFLGTVAVLRDITHGVELNRAKSEFVSSVSHELSIPITSIKGYTDLLMMEAAGSLNEQQVAFMRTIQNSVDRLATLVDDLLDISRIETGRLELNLEKVGLNQAVGDVIAELRPRADAKDLSLTNEIPVNLPSVRADPVRVAQIFTNLIRNAIAYTPEKKGIRVLGRLLDDQVQVDVIDDGIGIAPEEQVKIWDRFYRSDHPLVGEQAGTGLGLPIVRSLIELHGGKVWVESDLERGSTFSLTFPIMLEAWKSPSEG